MISVMGIAPQIGAALVAGVFMLINTLLTIFIIHQLNRRDKDGDDDERDERKQVIDVIDLEKGGLPIETTEIPKEPK